jgi:hypothetical protein
MLPVFACTLAPPCVLVPAADPNIYMETNPAPPAGSYVVLYKKGLPAVYVIVVLASLLIQ